jgi:hypothetical protein
VQVYALTGGLPPVMPTLDPSSLKRRQIPSKKVQMPSLRSLHLTAEVYNEHQTKKPSGWDGHTVCYWVLSPLLNAEDVPHDDSPSQSSKV